MIISTLLFGKKLVDIFGFLKRSHPSSIRGNIPRVQSMKCAKHTETTANIHKHKAYTVNKVFI